MRISAKARYGLSAMIKLSQNHGNSECTTIISLAERLKISKIYLEQVFSLLKRADLVSSTKGAGGGYQLTRTPKEISVLEVLSAIETSLLEKTDPTVPEGALEIENTMQIGVFQKLDEAICTTLSAISLEELVLEAENQSAFDNYMYYL